MRIDLIATTDRLLLDRGGEIRVAPPGASLDELFISDVPSDLAAAWFASGSAADPPDDAVVVAPIGSQEVWAAGVTYLRSRAARDAESKEPAATRSTTSSTRPSGRSCSSRRTAAPGRRVPAGRCGIRADSSWNVPEPELTLAVDSSWRDLRLHDRQRHVEPLDRGREPAVPAAGEGLRRLRAPRARRSCSTACPPPTRRSAWPSSAAAHGRLPAGDRPRQIKRDLPGNSPTGSTVRTSFRSARI